MKTYACLCYLIATGLYNRVCVLCAVRAEAAETINNRNIKIENDRNLAVARHRSQSSRKLPFYNMSVSIIVGTDYELL
jgi:hypothetical protein